MTSIAELQDLAALLHERRPDWDLVPTLNHLAPWRHLPYGQLVTAAFAVADKPSNRTPATLQWLQAQPNGRAESDPSPRKSKQPLCYICGRNRPDCAEMRAWEITNGVPDPHDFETADEAFANRSVHQLGDLIAGMDELRAARAKQRADHARAQIRPMIPTHRERVGALTPDDEPRKCSGCGGTLASGYSEPTHPGCGDTRPIQEPWPEETPA